MFARRKGRGIVFLVHTAQIELSARISNIATSLGPNDHLYVLGDGENLEGNWTALVERFSRSANVTFEQFSMPNLEQKNGVSGFKKGQIYPGSAQVPVLDIFRRTRHSFYWAVEWDVVLKGRWCDFFAEFEARGNILICAFVRPKSLSRDWYWWATAMQRSEGQPLNGKDDLWAGFFPVWGASAKAMGIYLQAMRKGWRGHYEAILPSIAQENGHELVDFARTAWTKRPDSANQEISSGYSFRFRPAITLEEFEGYAENTLLHPVKDVSLAWR